MNWGQVIYLGFILAGVGVIEFRASRRGLEAARAHTMNAWRDLDAALQDRLKHIPELMTTIELHARSRNEGLVWYEGFAASVRLACQRALEKISDPEQRAERENDVTRQLRALMQFTNTFPALIANPDFRENQRSLITTSHQIIEAQRFYNHQVESFNARLKRAWYPLVARIYRIRPMVPLRIDDVSLWFDEARDDLYLHIPRV